LDEKPNKTHQLILDRALSGVQEKICDFNHAQLLRNSALNIQLNLKCTSPSQSFATAIPKQEMTKKRKSQFFRGAAKPRREKIGIL
jgi:hypothetical protein